MSFLVVLGGCQATPVAPPAATDQPHQPPLAETPVPEIDPVVLHDLLIEAEDAIARDQLTYPVENSAYAIYARILQMQPGQEDALRGMEHIVEQYIAFAMQALQQHRYASARSMLSRARLVDPQHPSIEPTAEQIRLLSQAQREVLKLQQADLNPPQPAAARALRALAQVPDAHACRFTISAKNDAQGRWIYQQLAAGSNTTEDAVRIRAQIQIRLPAAVERLCFPA